MQERVALFAIKPRTNHRKLTLGARNHANPDRSRQKIPTGHFQTIEIDVYVKVNIIKRTQTPILDNSTHLRQLLTL
ncbi:hypothetical protein BRY73_18305 [Ochrobactrum sp. P6BS-III]|nr:hypothetical protein BRY73_18305 [Ochrobactrum sp. P6BS-III]